jgi:endo-alpha-1,4-polygalactosaminidase (GH114 family)
MRTRRATLAAAAAALAAASAPAPAAAAPDDARLQQVRTWALAIGGQGLGQRDVSGYDLVVADGAESTRRQVAALQANGTLVLGYLDVGTIERHRWWSRAARPYRLDRLEEWDEWYADVNARGYRRLIAGRIAPRMLKRKRFDGLFLDNTDMIETHPRRRPGMRRLATALSRLTHARNRLLFTQNGDEAIRGMLALYDGWNREDVSFTYDFEDRAYVAQPPGATAAAQRALRRASAKGLLATATDYLPTAEDPRTEAARQNACDAAALPFVTDIAVTRLPPAPLRC